MFHTKTESELSKLNDRNLLAYYRAERLRYNKNKSNYICDCCGEYSWNIYKDPDSSAAEIKFTQWWDYLKLIKCALSERGHVTKK